MAEFKGGHVDKEKTKEYNEIILWESMPERKELGNMLESIKYVIEEHIANYRLMIKVALMDSKKQTVRSSLGILWTYFHDILYMAVFILVRLMIAGNSEMMGMHSTVYLITGMIPWFFISDVLSQGSMSIRSNKGIIQSIRFPATLLPTISVMSIFVKRIFSFILIFIISFGFGYAKNFHPLLFIYYMMCLLALCLAMNLVFSAVITISEDFRQLYGSIIRVLIYTMPILWDFSRYTAIWPNVLLRINPMVYVVKGFRDAFVLGMTQDLLYSVYFWGCIVVIFAVGCFLQFKLKKFYADFV